jgi:hypothetical protein
MDLHSIVAPLINRVNPFVTATIAASTGYMTAADGKPVPTYAAPVTVSVQMQSLTYKDVVQLDSLNVQGAEQAFYIKGDWEGIVRADRKGGDKLIVNGRTYLIVQVLERWPDFVKVAGNLQVNP